MFRVATQVRILLRLALCAGLATLTGAVPGYALTVASPELEDLLETDGLGSCIPEASIEVGFTATGKGLRLPRTCLPEPCEQALTRDDLAGLLGFPPDDGLWDDYYARYAQYCRHEAVWPGEADEAPESIASSDSFWTPILVRGETIAHLRDLDGGSLGGSLGGGGGMPGTGGGTDWIGGGGSPASGGIKTPDVPPKNMPPDDGGSFENTPTPPKIQTPADGGEAQRPPGVVPLPMTLPLLLSAFGGLALARRRGRKKSGAVAKTTE